MPFTFGDEPAFPGDSNAVNCMITKGDLPLQIDWLMNGSPVQNVGFGINIVQFSPRLSTLNIAALEPKHRGQFECRATNEAGSTSATAELLLSGYWELKIIVLFFVYGFP